MDQHSRNVESSDTEASLSYSLEYSDTDSLVESVGSVGSESSRELASKSQLQFGRRRKDKKSGPQFLEFSRKLPDVPVSAAWEFIRDHRNMSDLVPGVIGHFDYLEGDGSTGSVFIANYSQHYNPDEKYVVNKVEVRDDVSHMYAVRCVGGRYQKRYPVYFTFIKVVSDEVLGDSSSSIIWRLQYELLDPLTPIPHETKMGYTTAIDLIRDWHLCLHRVQRPLVSQALSATMRKRWKRQAARQRRLDADPQASQQEEVEDPLEPRRKPRVLLRGLDRDGQRKQRPRGKSKVQLQLQGKDDEEEDRDQGKDDEEEDRDQGNDDEDDDRDLQIKQRPRRKSRVLQSQMKLCEEVNQDGRSSGQQVSLRRKASNKLQAAGSSGVVIRSKNSRVNVRAIKPQL